MCVYVYIYIYHHKFFSYQSKKNNNIGAIVRVLARLQLEVPSPPWPSAPQCTWQNAWLRWECQGAQWRRRAQWWSLWGCPRCHGGEEKDAIHTEHRYFMT